MSLVVVHGGLAGAHVVDGLGDVGDGVLEGGDGVGQVVAER